MENITFFNNSGSWDIQFAYGDSFSWKGGYIYSEVPNSQGAHSIDFGSNMDVHIEGVTFESIGGYNAKTAISLMCAPYIGSLTLKSITTKGFAGLGLLNANNVLVDGVNMIFDQDIGYAGLVSFGGPGGNNGNWTFVLQNTVFRDMRFGSTALFVSFGSNLLLSNVTFDNITVSGLAQVRSG